MQTGRSRADDGCLPGAAIPVKEVFDDRRYGLEQTVGVSVPTQYEGNEER